MNILGGKLIPNMRYVQEDISSDVSRNEMLKTRKNLANFGFVKFAHFHHDEKKRIFPVKDNLCLRF